MSLWLNDRPKHRKTIVTIVLLVFVLQIAVIPQPAYAILGVGDIVYDPAAWIQTAINWIKDNAYKVWERGLRAATWKAFQTAIQRFLGRIAYETAVWIGTGDKGKKPLLYTSGWKQYLEDAGDAAAGDFIETLADEWSGQADRKKQQKVIEENLAFINEQWNNRNCGSVDPYSAQYTTPRAPVSANAIADRKPDTISISCGDLARVRDAEQKKLDEVNVDIARTAPFLAAICTPPDGIQLKIALGLGTPTYPVRPKCTFSQMRDNWETAVEDPAFLNKFSVSFNPSQSDLGVALDLQSNLLIEQDRAAASAAMTRTADGAFKSVTSTVSGAIQTPARFLDKQMEQVIENAYAPSKDQPPPGIIEGVATIFTNTLISSLAERMKKGFWSLRDTAEKRKAPDLRGRVGQKEVEAVFASSIKNVKLQPNTNFDILSLFQQCVAEVKQQSSLYNCVLDAGFADALREAGGRALTVREALEQGLLHGEWSFGYADPAQGREPDVNAGYAASAMMKLRRFRILPVGWEFAAEYIRTRNQRYTLQYVIDCFEDPRDPGESSKPTGCLEQAKKDMNKDGVIDARDQWNPFWHLVDPNWVIKAPLLNCRAWGPGQQVMRDAGQRIDYCADAQDCVVENENGTCAAWGYCTREKNVWRFAGDKCDPQYDTCLTVKKEGTDEELSALQSSWDRAGCNRDTSGCAAHTVQSYDATKQNSDGTKGAWVNTTGTTFAERFFTNQASTCSDRAVGCRAFIEPKPGVNLVANGNFELGIEGDVPEGWRPQGQTFFTKSLPIAQRGVTAAVARDFAALERAGAQRVEAQTRLLGILPNHQYTVSAWAYIQTAPTQFGNIGIRVTTQQGGNDVAFASAQLNTSKINQWQEIQFGASLGSGSVDYPKIWLVADAGAEVFWDDVAIVEGGGGGFRPYGEGGLTHLRWTDETKRVLSCDKAEVGCALYTPENGDPAKAGIVEAGDRCPRECVGYASFTEQAPQNKFDVERQVDLIPLTATPCQREEVGCDEFTNLDEVAKGGEGLTYFTEIRQCQKPAPVSTDCAPFYTYEGSTTSGAQLQSYALKAAGGGDPATTDGSTTCDRNDANCRDFINAQGKHSFRDIRKTITCSNDCFTFRKTRSDGATCAATGGVWDGATCTYDIIPSEGKQCRKEANGCRAYVGNTGHVLRTVARTDFEQGKPKEWQSRKTVVTEAVRPGGHSLPLEPQERATWALAQKTLNDGARYTIAFLAKQESPQPGQSVTLTVRAQEQGGNTWQTFSQTITASGWRDYTVGPLMVQGNTPWVIEFQSSAALFIDDILVRRTNDQYTLVKDSWKTPQTCTQATIGCQAYRTGKNEQLTFSRLTNSCAFEKVGCSAFIDTQNSSSPFDGVWNQGDRAEVSVAEDKLVYLINRSDYACQKEERGCAALETMVPGKGGQLESKTAFIRDDPDLYNAILCSSKAERCATYLGEGGPYYLKDPKDKLCEYRKIPGSQDSGWFKRNSTSIAPDCPVGFAKLCPSNQHRCTKFIDPLDTRKEYPQGYAYYTLKNDNLDTGSCGTQVDRKAGCVLLFDTSTPRATYQAALTKEGSGAPETQCVNPAGDRIVSLNTATRPNEQALGFNGQKTFSVAPLPATVVDNGSYIVEFEAKALLLPLPGRQTQPTPVRVELDATPGSLSIGTILVNSDGWYRYTAGPVKLQRDHGLTGRVFFTATTDVVAVENVGLKSACDANVIVKVQRDRTCAEWVMCKSSVYQFDQTTGEYREVCTELGRCKEANPDNPTECKTAVPTTYKEKPLTRDAYQEDKTRLRWEGLEYTGYSLPNRYPVETLRQITRSPTKLTFVEKKFQGNAPIPCTIDNDCTRNSQGGDLCLNNECYENMGVDGSKEKTARRGKECRIYPDASSPLPSSLAKEWDDDRPVLGTQYHGKWKTGGGLDDGTGFTDYYTFLKSKKPGFTYAEICQRDANNDGKIDDEDREACDCSYKKVLYTNGENRYYAEQSKPPSVLMQYDVDPKDSSDESFFTYREKQEDTYLGWRGYCLEVDPNPKAAMYQDPGRKPCFTWWPVDMLEGEIGLFSNHPEAGFEVTAAGGPYYCLRSEFREYRPNRYNGGETDQWIMPHLLDIIDWAANEVKRATTGDDSPASTAAEGLARLQSGDVCDGNYNQVYRSKARHLFSVTYRWDCVPKGGPGWYMYDGDVAKDDDGNPAETVQHICTNVMQIESDQGESKPRTSRIVNNIANFDPAYTITPLGYKNETPLAQYGRVRDPMSPTAWQDLLEVFPGLGGRPYACFGPVGYGTQCLNGPGTGDTKNLPAAETEQKVLSINEGRDRLRELFARGYTWWMAPLRGVRDLRCRGICSTAFPQSCTTHDDCKVFDGEDVPGTTTRRWNQTLYVCSPDTCIGGPRKGEACQVPCKDASGVLDPSLCTQGFCSGTSSSDTRYKPCDPSRVTQCQVTRQDPSIQDGICGTVTVGKKTVQLCQGGPRNGTPCTGAGDCTVDAANTDAQCSSSVANASGACRHITTAGDLSGVLCDDSQLGHCTSNWDDVRCTAGSQKAFYNTKTLLWQPVQAMYEGSQTSCPTPPATFQPSTPIIKPGQSTVYAAEEKLNVRNPGNRWITWDDIDGGERPIIAAVTMNTTGQVTEGRRGRVTIGGKTEGDLVGENGIYNASLRFYAYNENGDQMPLRSIVIKWGDGSETRLSGKFQNHKNVCRRHGALVCALGGSLTSTACTKAGELCFAYATPTPAPGVCTQVDEPTKKAVNFGDSKDACVEDAGVDVQGYFVFDHQYDRPGTYRGMSVTIMDNWDQSSTATYDGKVIVKP